MLSKEETAVKRSRKPKARNSAVIIGGIHEHALFLTAIRIENCRELAQCHGERILELCDELQRSIASLNGKGEGDSDGD